MKWIPVTDQLPHEGQECIITVIERSKRPKRVSPPWVEIEAVFRSGAFEIIQHNCLDGDETFTIYVVEPEAWEDRVRIATAWASSEEIAPYTGK